MGADVLLNVSKFMVEVAVFCEDCDVHRNPRLVIFTETLMSMRSGRMPP